MICSYPPGLEMGVDCNSECALIHQNIICTIFVCLHRRLSQYGLRFWFAQRAVEMGYKRFAIMCM